MNQYRTVFASIFVVAIALCLSACTQKQVPDERADEITDSSDKTNDTTGDDSTDREEVGSEDSPPPSCSSMAEYSNDICQIRPQLCEGKQDGLMIALGNTLGNNAVAVAKVQLGHWSAQEGQRAIEASTHKMLARLQAPDEIRRNTIDSVAKLVRAELPKIEQKQASFAPLAEALAKDILGAALNSPGGEEEAEALAATTVTSTTESHFEFNFGIFKWGASTTVTEETSDVGDDEATTDSSGAGDAWATECDEDGNCVCVE